MKYRPLAHAGVWQAKKPAPKLLSLLEISKPTGISYPTLQRYVKLYPKQIPHSGAGRKRRYSPAAIEIFEEIRSQSRRPWPKRKAKEPAIRDVRPQPEVKKPARKSARKTAATAELSLLEISRRTGISYPTLLRYVKLHGKQIPSKGSGRKRRYPEEAVAVFQKLRSQSKRGRKPAAKRVAKKRAASVSTDASIAARIRALEKGQREIEKQLKGVIVELKKPIRVTIDGA